MRHQQADIQPYEEKFRTQLISVWEQSVRATHDFLQSADIDYYKQIVSGIDFRLFEVYCLTAGDEVLGFLGIADKKIEMLFLAPEIIGQGLGTKLMRFALDELHAGFVDVNEQNIRAVRFYEKFGFSVYERTEKDSERKDYPILKMRLG